MGTGKNKSAEEKDSLYDLVKREGLRKGIGKYLNEKFDELVDPYIPIFGRGIAIADEEKEIEYREKMRQGNHHGFGVYLPSPSYPKRIFIKRGKYREELKNDKAHKEWENRYDASLLEIDRETLNEPIDVKNVEEVYELVKSLEKYDLPKAKIKIEVIVHKIHRSENIQIEFSEFEQEFPEGKSLDI